MTFRNTTGIIKVIIAETLSMYRDGLRLVLKERQDIQIVAETADGTHLMDMVKHWQPDLLLIDLSLPGSTPLEIIKLSRALPKPPACIALTPSSSEQTVLSVLEAGAKGLLDKTAEKEEVVAAINLVCCGFHYFCESTTESMAGMLLKNPVTGTDMYYFPVFTAREKEIIRLICEEKTSQEISDALSIGVKTVNLERTRILEKMNVKTSVGVAIYAMKNMLVNV
ncbi:MAG TPA: response regulator transcription factor [Panacibacter sp.]|nr:response regulator transcription factor [Panacibacter sp.]HNP46820.1 response regulator transcription factor [Panacibacter sp.]